MNSLLLLALASIACILIKYQFLVLIFDYLQVSQLFDPIAYVLCSVSGKFVEKWSNKSCPASLMTAMNTTNADQIGKDGCIVMDRNYAAFWQSRFNVNHPNRFEYGRVFVTFPLH